MVVVGFVSEGSSGLNGDGPGALGSSASLFSQFTDSGGGVIAAGVIVGAHDLAVMEAPGAVEVSDPEGADFWGGALEGARVQGVNEDTLGNVIAF